MLRYETHLKKYARKLRKNMTDSERALWTRLRAKQLHGVQFYRQKPIGEHIVDFYAPGAKLVVEVDGSQHKEDNQMEKDEVREEYLSRQGLKLLRFNSREVLKNTDAVVQRIYDVMAERLSS
jgi:very-short-patch-repair endonuclease